MKIINWNVEKKDIKKPIYCILLALTIVRIIIALKIPLFAQGNAGADDYLFVAYAKSIVQGKWLGTFGEMTLVKAVSYSLFLVANNWLGLPYQLTLILFYICSIFVLVYALNKIIQNKIVMGVLYIFLLYSPVMLHQENVQKIYRGGVLVSSSILVIGLILGLYISVKSNKQIYWSFFSSIALPFFYYVKEDSLWIMPFVVGGALLTGICIFFDVNIKRKFIRIILTFLPIISLCIISTIYKSVNNKYYGEYTITDRTGTYFKNVLHDLLVISENKDSNPKIWVSGDAVEKAEKYSPTLRKYSAQLNAAFANSANNKSNYYYGDMFFWKLRNVLGNIYIKNGKYTNDFYKKVDAELQQAFKEGKLKKSKEIYLSPVAKGISKKDIPWFEKETNKYLATMYKYKYNKLSINQATGSISNILDMSQMTNSIVIWPGTLNTYKVKESREFIKKIQRNITSKYQKTGTICFVIGIVGFLLLTIKVFWGIVNKNYKQLLLWLFCVGILSSGLALFIGVEWFTRFLSMKKFYDYICCDIPIMQVLEVIGGYVIFDTIKEVIIKK